MYSEVLGFACRCRCIAFNLYASSTYVAVLDVVRFARREGRKMDVYPDIELADRTLPGAWIGENAYASTYRGAYLCWLVLASLISFGIYIGLRGIDWEFATRVATFFGIFLCATHFLYVSRLRPVNYLSPDLLFWLHM